MIWGIYLAAGQSIRMGRSKLCLPIGDRPLGSFALEAAMSSMLNGVAVVTRAADTKEWIPASMFDNPHRRKWIHVPCETAHLGMAESLKCGLRKAQEMQAQAVMVLLADQPFVTAMMMDQMITLYKKENKAFIAASHEGIPLPPVLFDSCLFPDLSQLQGDEGARRIIRIHREHGMTIDWPVEDKGLIDIDTPDDYDSLLNRRNPSYANSSIIGARSASDTVDAAASSGSGGASIGSPGNVS